MNRCWDDDELHVLASAYLDAVTRHDDKMQNIIGTTLASSAARELVISLDGGYDAERYRRMAIRNALVFVELDRIGCLAARAR